MQPIPNAPAPTPVPSVERRDESRSEAQSNKQSVPVPLDIEQLNRVGGFYFHGDAVLGSNVNITHGVVLGYMNRGSRRGAPVIGDRSFLGSGAKVIGGIAVGAEAAIGANAVVTKDVPERGVVGGIPAKLLSDQGSDGYINRLAPPELLAACEGALHGSRTKPA